MLAILFAEDGADVPIHERPEENLRKAAEKGKETGLAARVHACKDHDSLCQQLGSPKVFFSHPHGGPGDSHGVNLSHERRHSIDGSNENYLVT
jgi:hypothetical protein